MKILIVDDSSTMRRIIINTLSRIGYTDVMEAENGKVGLDQLAKGGVEMIITDWNMPEMDGLEFVGIQSARRTRAFRSSWSRPTQPRRTSSRPCRPWS